MKSKKLILGGIVLAVLAAVVLAGVPDGNAANKASSAGGGRESLQDVETLVQANSSFALDLYKELRSREGNLSFSPYSISMVLSMTYEVVPISVGGAVATPR